MSWAQFVALGLVMNLITALWRQAMTNSNSVYSKLSDYSGQQSPHEYH